VDIPSDKAALRAALIAQRQYTLALYRDLPAEYWLPENFPYSTLVNPPLWELSHIAYFAEFFATRWTPDDVLGVITPSLLDVADSLFNSSLVGHRDRWINTYPSMAVCVAYTEASLMRVLAALESLETDDGQRLALFHLVLVHEDMHAESLLMTLRQLGLASPNIPGKHLKPQYPRGFSGTLQFAGGPLLQGASDRQFKFCNELPPFDTDIAPFEIDAAPVSAADFARWFGKNKMDVAHLADDCDLAMHMSHVNASAYAKAHGRRLPTESEWEFAASSNERFLLSTGEAWEWTSTVFAPYPGFRVGAYAEYSEPWFPESGTPHYVLKGGSFATHPRLKYPQYRNFYTPERSDMFCTFRTCAM
jgi:EgtB-related family protein